MLVARFIYHLFHSVGHLTQVYHVNLLLKQISHTQLPILLDTLLRDRYTLIGSSITDRCFSLSFILDELSNVTPSHGAALELFINNLAFVIFSHIDIECEVFVYFLLP